MKRTIRYIIALCGLLVICLLSSNSHAQTISSQIENNLQVRFLKDSIEVEEGSFQFNNIMLVYTGNSAIQVEVKSITPTFVNIISSSTTHYLTLSPKQQQIIPIRFNVLKNISSSKWYPFTLSIFIKQTGQTLEHIFWLKMASYSKWKCSLVQPDALLAEHEDKVDFSVRIDNIGNTEDEYEVQYESEVAIAIPKKETHLVLPAGAYKTVQATAHLTYQQLGSLNKTSINIYVKNKAGEKRLLVQKITRIGHQYTADVYAWKQMPLTVELGAQNFFDKHPYYSAAAYGTLAIAKDKSLSVLLQSNNFYSGLQTNSHIATATYTTPDWKITAGTISDFNHFLINGNGLRIKHITRQNGYIEMAGIKSHYENTNQFDFKLLQPVNTKISFASNSFVNLDAGKHINSYLTVNTLSWTISKSSKLSVEGGGGMDQINNTKHDTTLAGPMYGYAFESNLRNISVASKISYYSKNFPGFNKGFEYHNHIAKMQLGKYSLAGFYEANKKIYTNPEDSLLRLLLNTNDKEYGLRSGFVNKKFYLNTAAGIYQQRQDSANSLVSSMLKFTINATWSLKNNISFSLFSNTGYVHIKNRPDIRPFMAFTNFGSIQAKSVGLQFRYDEGPFYYYQMKQYAQLPLTYRQIQIAPFFDRHFKKQNTFLRLQMNYNYEQPYHYSYLLWSNQLIYSPPRLHMDLGLLTNINFKRPSGSLVSFTVRKQLQLPVYKNADSYNFSLVLFKDVNGNNEWDKNDKLIANANVLANGTWLQTDATGQINFKNVSGEPLALDFSKINNTAGWMPRHGFKQTVQPGRQPKKIYIPFKESKTITGKLVLVADDKSSQTLSLDNIRITVTDDNGNTFNTLTDVNGAFAFNLPAGNYMVSVNEAVFDNNFKPIEFSKMADLNYNSTIDLTFEIIQKKRQINIKKSD